MSGPFSAFGCLTSKYDGVYAQSQIPIFVITETNPSHIIDKTRTLYLVSSSNTPPTILDMKIIAILKKIMRSRDYSVPQSEGEKERSYGTWPRARGDEAKKASSDLSYVVVTIRTGVKPYVDSRAKMKSTLGLSIQMYDAVSMIKKLSEGRQIDDEIPLWKATMAMDYQTFNQNPEYYLMKIMDYYGSHDIYGNQNW